MNCCCPAWVKSRTWMSLIGALWERRQATMGRWDPWNNEARGPSHRGNIYPRLAFWAVMSVACNWVDWLGLCCFRVWGDVAACKFDNGLWQVMGQWRIRRAFTIWIYLTWIDQPLRSGLYSLGKASLRTFCLNVLQALEKASKHPMHLLQPRYEFLTDKLQRKCVDWELPKIPFPKKWNHRPCPE